MQPSPPRAMPSLVHSPRSSRTGIEGARNLRGVEPLFEPSNPPSSRASRAGAGVEPRRSRDSEHRKLHASPERANRAVYCYRSVCRPRFFESLSSFLEPIQGREEVESDSFRFIVHELFISLIAVLLRYERFEFAAHMMSTPYLRKRPNASSRNIRVLPQLFAGAANKERRLELRRLSLLSDMLIERCKGTPLTDRDLYQADFTLFLRPCFDVLNKSGNNSGQKRCSMQPYGIMVRWRFTHERHLRLTLNGSRSCSI
jgi:hypothetical protein